MPPKKTAKKTASKSKKTRSSDAKTKAKKAPETKEKELIECTHCEGTGRCAAGEPYEKDHHQGVFKEERLISCMECLEAAGKSRKAKRMVNCRFCKGTGKVEKPE